MIKVQNYKNGIDFVNIIEVTPVCLHSINRPGIFKQIHVDECTR